MGDFKSLPPDGKGEHTVEILSDKGVITVFLDGMEVKKLTEIVISADPPTPAPLVTMTFRADAVTVEGDMEIRKQSVWDDESGRTAMGVGGPVLGTSWDRGVPRVVSASGTGHHHGGTWADPGSDPIGDLVRAKEALERKRRDE